MNYWLDWDYGNTKLSAFEYLQSLGFEVGPHGSPAAFKELMPLYYEEFYKHKINRQEIARCKPIEEAFNKDIQILFIKKNFTKDFNELINAE